MLLLLRLCTSDSLKMAPLRRNMSQLFYMLCITFIVLCAFIGYCDSVKLLVCKRPAYLLAPSNILSMRLDYKDVREVEHMCGLYIG